MKSVNKSSIILLGFIGCQIFQSCNFNISNVPGPQVSSNIGTSKRHGTFICEYTISSNKINGVRIESLFAEKKYSLSEGLAGDFKIDCCESQLVISLKDDNTIITLNDVAQNWEIIGFKSLNSKIIVKDFKGDSFPDSLVITIRPDLKNEYMLDKLTLHKVK